MLSELKNVLLENKDKVSKALAAFSGITMDSSLVPVALESLTGFTYQDVDGVDCLGTLIEENFFPEFEQIESALSSQGYIGLKESDFYDFCKKSILASLGGEDVIAEIKDDSVFSGLSFEDIGRGFDADKAADLFIDFVGSGGSTEFFENLLTSLYPDDVLGSASGVVKDVVNDFMASSEVTPFIEDLVAGALFVPESSVNRLEALNGLAENTLMMGSDVSYWTDLLIAQEKVELEEEEDVAVEASLSAVFDASMGSSRVRKVKAVKTAEGFGIIASRASLEKSVGIPPKTVRLAWSEFIDKDAMKLTAFIYKKDPASRRFGAKLKAIAPDSVKLEERDAKFFSLGDRKMLGN